MRYIQQPQAYMPREMDAKARKMQNEYNKRWRKKNPDRVREYTQRYWKKKVIEAEQADHGGDSNE